jgi:hypothetical protein
MRVYEIPARVRQYLDAVDEDGVVPPELEGVITASEDAILYQAAYIQEKAAEIEALKAEIKRLSDKAARKEKTVERLKREAAQGLAALGIKKTGNAIFTVTARVNVRTIIDDENTVPAEFKQTVVKEEVKIDKTAIKAAIKGGAVVEGAHLEENQSVVIK